MLCVKNIINIYFLGTASFLTGAGATIPFFFFPALTTSTIIIIIIVIIHATNTTGDVINPKKFSGIIDNIDKTRMIRKIKCNHQYLNNHPKNPMFVSMYIYVYTIK